MAKAQEIGLSADDSYAEAAARTVGVRADELVEYSNGVLDTATIENLHDMRVATRRLRAALEVFEPCFPAKPYRRALRDVKPLADALGERRDRDVTIAGLRGFGAEMPVADQRGINALVEVLGAEQREANDRLAPMVAFEQVEELRAALLELAASARAAGRLLMCGTAHSPRRPRPGTFKRQPGPALGPPPDEGRSRQEARPRGAAGRERRSDRPRPG